MLLAVTGMGFASCSSADEAEVNPTYDPVAGTVNADFVFNISTGNSTQTRQNAANTQATIDQVFRGIDNAHLMTFKRANDGSHVYVTDAANAAADLTATKAFPMGTVLNSNALDPDGTGSTPKSRRILELSLPVETNAIMFWGKAPLTETDGHVQGKITFNADNKDIRQHAFSLVKCVDDANQATLGHYEELILEILNTLSNVTYTAAAGECTWSVADGGDGTTNADPITIKWGDNVLGTQTATTSNLTMRTYSNLRTVDPSQNDELSAFGEISARAFYEMHKIWSGELRAGSGKALHYVLADLYRPIHSIVAGTPTSYNEYVIQQLANQVETVILHAIDPDGTWKSITQIKNNFNKSSLSDVTGSLDDFPSKFGLPQGGTQLLCAITSRDDDHNVPFSATWSYNQSPVGPGTGANPTATGGFTLNTCMFPAELCYFGNSPVHVTDNVKVPADYPDGSGTGDGEWMKTGDGTKWADWSLNSHVKSTSRAVAMAQNINYGSALLKTTVAYGAGTITDNNAAIQAARNSAHEADKSIAVTTAGQFNLTGILIGGQEQTMGWNYLPKAASPTYNCVIYDNQIVQPTIPIYGATTPMEPTYTLVWDNYNPAQGVNTQQKVYVALELVNNTGESFWGKDNLVRNGGTFYLIGALDPAALITADATNGTDYANIVFPAGTLYHLPPYDANGTTIQAKRVFIQDYMTSANFVIGVNSLKSAYVTVPDLRSTQISLGLSVDLNWNRGLNFGDVTLGQ